MFHIQRTLPFFAVDSCKHDVEEDAEAEQEIRNIEKIRLEIRRRREMKTGKPLTEVTYVSKVYAMFLGNIYKKHTS